MWTVAYRTLEGLLNFFAIESLKPREIERESPYFLIVKLKQNTNQNLHKKIISFCDNPLTIKEFIAYE